MMKRIIYIITIIFFLIACMQPKRTNSRLTGIDSLMEKYPDSALCLLQKIKSEEINTQADQAYYALLLTQARDKNYILAEDDSLIRIAVCHYDSTGATEMQARAHYLWGSYFRDKNECADAVREYLRAIPLAEKANDKRLQMVIYNNLGYIYYTQDLDQVSDSICSLTKKLAVELGDTIALIDVLSLSGKINMERGPEHYSKAESQMLQAYALSNSLSKPNISYYLSILYSRMNKEVKAIKFAKEYIALQKDTATCFEGFSILGEAYYKSSQYDSATIFLRKGLLAKEKYIKEGCYMRLADIAKEQKKFEEAANMEWLYSTYLDSTKQILQENTIKVAKTELQLKQQQFKSDSSIEKKYYFLIIFSVLCSLALFLLWRILHNNVSRKQEAQEMALLQKAYEYSDAYMKMGRIIQSYKSVDKSNETFDDDDWKQLLIETDKRYNNVTTRLKADYKLTQKEIRICCYMLSGFPTNSLAYLLNCSRDTIYRKLYLILEKMEQPREMGKFKEILEKYTNNTLLH